jgi:hypothetical protein
MAVRIARGTISYLRNPGGNLYLQVRAADYGLALLAVRAAVPEIWAIRSSVEPDDPAASYISEVMRLPAGPAIGIDLADEPVATRRAVVDVLLRHVVAAGVEDGEVGPPRNRLDAPFFAGPARCAPGVRYPELLIRSRRPRAAAGFRVPPIPPSWVGALTDWVLQDVGEDDEVWVGIVAFAFKAPAVIARTMLDPPAGGIINIAAGDGSLRMLMYSGCGVSYEARLRTYGPDVRDEDADAVVTELQQVARGIATDVDYAMLDYTEPGVHHWRPPHTIDISPSHPGYVIPDVFWWQILSPHHALIVSHDAPPGLLLPGDRREVAFGTFHDWREPEPSRVQRQNEALSLLGPLIRSTHYIIVTPDRPELRTREEIAANVDELLPGGTWTAPSRYQVLGPDYAVDVELDRNGITFWPAGRRGITLARAASASFPGRVIEHNPTNR